MIFKSHYPLAIKQINQVLVSDNYFKTEKTRLKSWTLGLATVSSSWVSLNLLCRVVQQVHFSWQTYHSTKFGTLESLLC